MNRNDRPDELRDRLLDDVPATPTGFWAELTDRLEDADTDTGSTRLTTMNTNETNNRPPLRTRALALAAGAAVVAGAGAVALRGGDDVTTAADDPSTTTVDDTGRTTTTIEGGTTSAPDTTVPIEVAEAFDIERCYGLVDDDSDLGPASVSVRIRETDAGAVSATVSFSEPGVELEEPRDALQVFTGERLAEIELDGALLIRNRSDWSDFFGRAELWFDSVDELRLAEDLVLPGVDCGTLPGDTFAGAAEVAAAAPEAPPVAPALAVGSHCFAATEAPFAGSARIVVADDGTVEVRRATSDGESSRAGVGRFVSDLDIVVTVTELDGFEMEPFFERWIVADDGSLRPAEVVPAGVFAPIDCGDLPDGFETAGRAGSESLTAAGNGLDDVQTVDFAALGVAEEGCWYTDAADDRVIVFVNGEAAVVVLDGAPVRLDPTGDPVALPFGVVSTYAGGGVELEIIAGDAAPTEFDSERFNGSVSISLPSGAFLPTNGFHACGV